MTGKWRQCCEGIWGLFAGIHGGIVLDFDAHANVTSGDAYLLVAQEAILPMSPRHSC